MKNEKGVLNQGSFFHLRHTFYFYLDIGYWLLITSLKGLNYSNPGPCPGYCDEGNISTLKGSNTLVRRRANIWFKSGDLNQRLIKPAA